jgi:hypothetical protein
MTHFDPAAAIHRRTFLNSAGVSLGSAALSALMAREGRAASGINSEKHSPVPHHRARVKRIIYLYMSGGPSHLETFDEKPMLAKMHGQAMPESFTKGQPIAQLQGQKLTCQGPMIGFRKHGESGQVISDFLPWHGKMADDICILRSMVTEQINHDPAHTFMNTGTAINGRPSMGSWVTYGLGSECDDLPGFVVLTSEGGRNPQPISSRMWAAGFLPSQFQGVPFESTGDPVHYVGNPAGVSMSQQRRLVDAIRRLDEHRAVGWDSVPTGRGRSGASNGRDGIPTYDPEVAARIAAYELAFKMQSSVPELMDLSGETQATLDMYGAKPGDGSFASNCLLARRMAERGVRFIQLYHRDWDHHGDLVRYMNICCGLTDRPAWALLTDLKQRGMLDETLIIWGGEFGRTPMFQGKGGPGRDHHSKAFSMWLAGGGVRGATTYGATDELGYNSVENVVHVRDLHATMLHQLGIDHERFSVKHQGLDSRLTGVEKARVLHEVLT